MKPARAFVGSGSLEVGQRQYLRDDELAALLRAARERRHRNALRDFCLLSLLASTGIRPGEAVQLTLGDLHLAGRDPWIRVRRLKSRRVDGKLSDVPVARRLASTLTRHAIRMTDAGAMRLFPMTVRSAENVFRYYAGRAGLEGHRLYALRHTALTRALRVSGDIRLVQDMAGHSSPVTTTVYAHVDPERKREVAEAIG